MMLAAIVHNKKQEITRLKKTIPLARLKKEALALPKKTASFLKRLRRCKGLAVIAEIKRRSPSKGLLRKHVKPISIAKAYEKSGAAAISVLTDEKFFGGSVEILKDVRLAAKLPILRKDFIIDEYQVYESRLMGADAILLIAGILSKKKIKSLSALAGKLGLDVLFEVHSKQEIGKILPARPKLIGINNRDLKSFNVDIAQTRRLLPFLPKGALVVSESGIQSARDIRYLRKLGVRAVLVGETLMKSRDVGQALKKLLGSSRGTR